MFLFARALLKAPVSANAQVYSASVRFQDADVAGIAFYPRIQEYFHDAYLDFLTRHGFPLHEVLALRKWLAPIRHAEADYLKPLRFGQRFSIALSAAHLEANEATLAYQLRTELGLHAVGQTVHTFVDFHTFQRSEIPADLREAFQSIGEPQAL